MGDSKGNPFISNPFMQGAKKKPPVSPEPERPASTADPTEPHGQLNTPPPTQKVSKPANKSNRKTATKSATKSAATKKPKSPAKTTAAKSYSSSQRLAQQPATPSYGSGYKVQVLAKIPMPTNTNMPSRDYLWFAVYPIIPRVGDCIFHDGRYFRVDAVFLYENTNASWCADIEVSYYTRRQ